MVKKGNDLLFAGGRIAQFNFMVLKFLVFWDDGEPKLSTVVNKLFVRGVLRAEIAEGGDWALAFLKCRLKMQQVQKVIANNLTVVIW